MADLILTDEFNASLRFNGDADVVEVRAEESGVLVDLELNNEKLRLLHAWIEEILGISHTVNARGVEVGTAPVLGRIELVLRNG